MIQAYLGDSKLATAICNLLVAGHNLNRWDLTEEAITALCDAALRYAAEHQRFLADRGMSHE